MSPTLGPYGDCPFSSLFCRTLWKSYLFSWRTKLAKLLCLKCLGRMVLVNFSHYSRKSSSQSTFLPLERTGRNGRKLPPRRRSCPPRHPNERSPNMMGPRASFKRVRTQTIDVIHGRVAGVGPKAPEVDNAEQSQQGKKKKRKEKEIAGRERTHL